MVTLPRLYVVTLLCLVAGCRRGAINPTPQRQDLAATPQAFLDVEPRRQVVSESRSLAQTQNAPGEASQFDSELFEVLRLSDGNVARAIESLARKYKGEQLAFARKRLIALLCQKNSDETASLLRYLRSKEEQNWVLSSTANYWVHTDPIRAISISTHLAGDSKSQFLHYCVRSFAEIGSYRDAAKAFSDLPASPQRERLAKFLGNAWARANPEEALEWAANLSVPAEQQAAFLSLIDPVGQRGGADAIIGLINKIDDPLVLERGVQAATRLLVSSGQVDTALGWIEALSGETRRSGLIQLIDAAALQDPERWLAYAKASSDRTLGRDLISVLALRVANRDPVQAAQMLTGLEPDQYAMAVNHVVTSWHHANAAGLYRWLESTPPGMLKDSALVALTQKLDWSDKNAGAAVSFANQISDPDLRQRTLSAIRKAGSNQRLILVEEPTLTK